MTRYCPHCYVGIDPEDEFCKNCGTPLKPEGETVSEESDTVQDAHFEKAAADAPLGAVPEAGNNEMISADAESSAPKVPDASETAALAEAGKAEAGETPSRSANAFEREDVPPEPTKAAPKDKKAAQEKEKSTVISLGEWMWSLLLTFIPVVNLIVLIIWSVTEETNPSKKNFARARLIYAGIGIVMWILVIILIIITMVTIGATGSYYYY